MARAELVQPADPEVIVTLSKREAAMLTILSGQVPNAEGINRELYDLLHAFGKPYGMDFYDDGEAYLGATLLTSTIELREVND